jgi:hypothetical protein
MEVLVNSSSSAESSGGGPIPLPDDGGTRARVKQRERESRQADQKAENSRQHETRTRRRLEEQRAATDSNRHLSLPLVGVCILLAAMLEVFAAEPGAEALGFDSLLTYVITVIFVAAVVGGAIILAHSTGDFWRFLLAFQIFVLVVLFSLRLLYLTAFEPFVNAFLAAAGLTLLTCVIYLIAEELARRAVTLDLWKATREAKKAESDRRRQEKKAIEAGAELQKAIDARDVFVE